MNKNKSNIIKASEISQYKYCSISWKLIREGYIPKSPNLKKGINTHFSHGKIITHTNSIIKKYNILLKIGYTILFFALLIILSEVIL